MISEKMNRTSITDIPRNVSVEKDCFGIEPFEKGLTKFISSTNTPITIALQGEWGSGKTSLMNSLKMNLCEGDNSKYHSIWINTWEYALIQDTYSTLIDIVVGLIEDTSKIAKLDDSNTKKIINTLCNIGKSTMKFAAKTAADKMVSGSSEIVDELLAKNNNSSIKQIRHELEIAIEKCMKNDNKEGFVFFIDDLDRIDPPVAVQLLELLKNIFDLKNCVFILAIDYDVVVKGLEPKYGKLSDQNEREFRSFFDKIIQVPFSMPVTSYRINDFLKDGLLSINYIDEIRSNNKELIVKFSEISSLSVGSNPRALKRLLNSLSLINCINSTKNQKDEDNILKDDLELLVNFALVSIQIAFPQVYKLLTIYPGFNKWNENVALQMNLKQLEEQSLQKLKQSEEFDEEWEQVLFRLCENDHYLKKKSLNISRLLNSLRLSITEDSIEDYIGSIISLSSVTNIEAFDKPEIHYHRGNFLKHFRTLLIPKLKERLPEIKDNILPLGKRVQVNAIIAFTENKRTNSIILRSHPFKGEIRLMMVFEKRLSPAKCNTIQETVKQAGIENEFNILEKDYNNFIEKYPDFSPNKFYDVYEYKKEYVMSFVTSLVLPSTDDFYKADNITKTSYVISEMYHFFIRLQGLSDKLYAFFNNA